MCNVLFAVLDDVMLQRFKINEIVNKFLLAGDKLMPEMHLIPIALVNHLLKIKRDNKSLLKQEISSIFIKTN